MTTPTMPAAVARYRARYRKSLIPRSYNGRLHLLSVFVLVSAAIATLVMLRPQAFIAYAWVVPATLLVANFVEYWAHRGPMHHRNKWLAVVFERHTCRHHRYFRDTVMGYESAKELHVVLFPTALLLFFAAIASGLGLLLSLFLGGDGATVFVATTLAYYLIYEALHLAYHSPEARWVHWIPGLSRLANLHRVHHGRSGMHHANFNLTLPLFDWIFGTLQGGVSRACGKRVLQVDALAPAEAATRWWDPSSKQTEQTP